jgi:hypothetical protein
MRSFCIRTGLCISALALLAACSNDAGPTEPDNQSSTIQLNTTTAPAYLTLGSPASVVSVADPASSTAWDLAFTPGLSVNVNGGASGSAGVEAYCLCAHASLALAQIEGLSASDGADAFAAVTSAAIPTDASFQLDASSQAITGWYDYNTASHAISTNNTAWGIRLASTAGNYAKFHVTAIPTPGQSNAGPVTLEWATQTGATGALGADRTLSVDLSSGAKVFVDLTAGTSSASAASTWDVALQNYTIYVNGGTSGSGNVAAVSLVPSSFYTSYAAITTIPVGAQGIPSNAFTTDGAGGAFLANEPYRYDESTHQVWPTLDVYLVKRGSAVYKVQVTSYYSTDGAFGNVTVRYAKLTQ